MRNVIKFGVGLFLFILSSNGIQAQTDSVKWALTSSPGNGVVVPANANIVPAAVSTGANFTGQQFSGTKGFGTAGQNGAGNKKGWNELNLNAAVTNGAFIEFAITINGSCINFNVDSISFTTETTNGDLDSSILRFSTDNFVTFTSLGAFPNKPDNNAPAERQLFNTNFNVVSGQTVKFRLFGADLQSNQDTLYVRDFVVKGVVSTLTGPTLLNTNIAICSNTNTNITLTASSASTFSWTVGTVTGGITGATANSGSTINDVLVNPSNVNSGTVEYIVTPVATSGNCPGAPQSITVTVNPRPSVTNSSPVTVCSGNSPNINLTASVALGTFNRSIASNPGGITGATTGLGGTINDVLTNPSNSAIGTINYSVTPTSPQGCTGNAFNLAVEVRPAPQVTNSSPVAICSGDNTNLSLNSTIPSSFTFSLGTVSPNISGASSGSGSVINQILSNSSNSNSGSVIYNIIPTSNVNGCLGASFALTITVNPRPVMNGVTSDETCSGISPNTPLSASALSTFSSVVSTVTGGVTGASPSSATTLNQILTNPSNSLQGSVTYQVTPTSNAGCTGTASLITVLVNPTPAMTNSSPVSVCSGNSLNLTLTASVLSSTFNRSIGANPGNITGATAGAGGTINDVLTNPSITNSGTINYSIIPTSSPQGCTGSAFNLAVEVKPAPEVTNASPVNICSGDNSNITLNASVNSNFSFTLGTVSPNISGASGGSGNSISQVLINSSNSNSGAVIYNVVPTSIANTCQGASFALTVNVRPRPVMTIASTDSACSGFAPNTALTASTGANSTFSWVVSTVTGSVTGAFPSSGSTLNQTLNNPSNSLQGSVTYQVSPTSNAGCTGTASLITIFVNPTPAMTNSSPATVCSGIGLNLPLTASVTSTFNRSIGSNPGTITGFSTGAGGAINDILTNPSNTNSGTINYSIVPTSFPQGCTGGAFNLAVEVKPAPAITNESQDTICSGDTTNIVLAPTIPSTFSWTIGNITGSINGAIADAAGIIKQELINLTTNARGVVPYIITPVSLVDLCPGSPDTINVVVNPAPPPATIVDLTDSLLVVNSSVCSGSSFLNFNISNNLSGITYSWSAQPSFVIVHIDDTANTVISFPDTTFSYTATITAITANISSLGGCPNKSSDIQITVTDGDPIQERGIILKQPGNLLVYPDNTVKGFQWGFDNKSNLKPQNINDQIYQVLVHPDSLPFDTLLRSYWVELNDSGCVTKVYFNGPNKFSRPGSIDVIAEELIASAFPNPNNGTFDLLLSGNMYESIKINVLNTLGQNVYSTLVFKSEPEQRYPLKLPDLDRGFYILDIRGMNGEVISDKILINK
jgi:hypothetical protein